MIRTNFITLFVLSIILVFIGCSVNNSQSPAEAELQSKLSRFDELERKLNTQSTRINQVMTTQDSLISHSFGSNSNMAGGQTELYVIYESELFFRANVFQLNTNQEQILSEVAELMAKHPSSTLQIIGHSDKTGNAFYNQQLSRQRSDAALRFLVDSFGIPLFRMESLGFGFAKQKYTRENSTKNRRIDVLLVAPKSSIAN